jgi:uncharacterized protein YecT (DUF1311 family)
MEDTGMKRTTWIVLGWLVLGIGAQAASFDCGKAQSKVEHLICDNPEISRLDEELSTAYKTALQDKKQAESLKQAQKQWMKERNGCADADCVKSAYVTRLPLLRSSHTGKVNSNFSGQWHLAICDTSISKECGGFTVYLIQTESKICGDHFFATPGGGRLNEGAPRSITGSVSESGIANIVITSGRNGAVFRVRATENDDTLNWTVIEELKRGPEGDSALVLEKGDLKRETENSSYRAAFSACQRH